MIFGKKKEPERIPYDPSAQAPAVRTSICTGEQTVGFVDRKTGKFHEYEAAADRRDIERFCRAVGIRPEDLRRIY